jgi:tRNA nucleotidyltransferase (CCA-adding enzyme)
MSSMATLELPERLGPILGSISGLSGPYEGVYLVGGTVRDILLGEPSFDVDIVVEGDAIALARDLAVALDGRVRAHPKFGTAVVLYDDGERVDVVTARSESYHAPAVLPTVEPGTIEEDLDRRDFTINAMAVSLKDAETGRLVDPFHGRADVEAGLVRVLHDRSFIDDPTRILRAIRYEDRYGFRMDEHTAELARICIATGHVGDLSGARLREELIALLEEGDVSHAIPRLGELGAEKEIHPHVVADEEAVRLFDRLRELNRRYRLQVPAWRLGLAALARRMPEDEISPWLDGLKLRRRDAEQIKAAVTEGPAIARELGSNSLPPAEVVALAERHAPDAPLFALAISDLLQLHEYFERLGGIELEIDGNDMAALGLAESPRVGEILAELRRRKLNGELDGRESELAAARELIEQP